MLNLSVFLSESFQACMFMFKFVVSLLILMLCPCLGACTPLTDQKEFDETTKNRENLYVSEVPEELTLDAAIDIAVNNNLDAKIAEQDFIVSLSDVELQKWNALPTITAKRDFLKRNNFAASSSVSAETGVQSLEPSISSDRSSRVTALDLNWELVDAAINIYRASSIKEQSQIANERYRKVIHNIILDTHSAYYRLAALQKNAETIGALLEQSEQELEKLSIAKKTGDIPFEKIDNLKKEIFETRSELLNQKKQQRLAEIELRAMLSVSPDKPLKLAYDALEQDFEKQIAELQNVDVYVDQALKARPEIQEEYLNLRITQRNLNAEVLSSFPGLKLFAAANNDDNSFLEEQDWFNLTATISQSITGLLTLPSRYKKSKEEIELANTRKKALIAAVIFQVNIAYMELQDTSTEFTEEKRVFDVSEDAIKRENALMDSGLSSTLENFVNVAQHESYKLQLEQKRVDVLLAHQRLKHSVGDFSLHNTKKLEAKYAFLSPKNGGADDPQ